MQYVDEGIALNPAGQPQFMPHGMCYLWDPQLLLLHILSDGIIALAYFSIPITLLYFLRKRGDVPFGGTIAMFGVFIVCCGLTHVMGIWTIWHPDFWLDGWLKALTAAVSLGTAATLVPLIPRALTLRTPAALDKLNAELERGLAVRREALEKSEWQYLALADAMPLIVWTAEPSGSIDYYNRRWLEYTGLTFAESAGWGWRPVLHPDDLAGCSEVWDCAVRLGTPYEMEFRLKRASDGAFRWHLGRALPARDAGGSIIKWYGTCTDIDDQKRASESAGRLTEQLRLNQTLEEDLRARKRAEAALRASDERYRQIEEHAPVGLALLALDGSFTRVSPALAALLGYPELQLLTMSLAELTHSDDSRVDRISLEQLLDGSIGNYEVEKRYVRKGGAVIWTHLNVSLVRDDAGEPSYLIAQVQDISERKAAEEAVKTAERAALAATETKSRFLAMMSHEIRTPMNGIIGMTELLALSDLSAEQSEFVNVVRDSGHSLLRVLNDILDYSKIEAGKLDLELDEFDPLGQVHSVVSLLRPQFEAKRVALTVQADSGVPATLKGDAGRVRQILINLVGNALKFTPAGGNVRISVSVEPRSGETATVRFAVADSGLGIAPELRDRLFQPFSQLDASATRKYGGTGLGLSICKQLVDLMDGSIGVDSALGNGATFWFTIPFALGRSGAPGRSEPVLANGERRAAPRRRAEKLLLAEDNAVNALLALKQFERLGFGATVVTNGREAVDAVSNEHFDVVFMDCHMPEMDGLKATREIRHLPSDKNMRVPIVAMTADAQAEDKAACLAAGMDDYVSKPATLADLRRVLGRWLPGGGNLA